MLKTAVPRISAIDILRAITMTLMIFVNDLWSLKDIPLWLEHTAAQDDAMGLADVVFPAFLVLVGMSAPFSIAARRAKGASERSITVHIVQRSFALIIMGVFLVNGETLNAAAMGIPKWIWFPLCCFCFILAWNKYPPSMTRSLRVGLTVSGGLILLFLAWFYRGGDDGRGRFGTSWWGILGLIGWAYLVSAIVLNYARNNILLMFGFWTLCVGLNIITHADALPGNTIFRGVIAPFEEGAMPAFVTGGMIVSLLFIRYRERKSNYRFIALLVVLSTALCLLGFLLRPLNGISKIQATPSWVLICTALTCAAFAFVFWLADIQRKENWFKLIKPAGTNTLTCYLVPYFIYGLMNALSVQYPDAISHGAVGLSKSMLFAFLVVIIAGWLGRRSIQVKL